MQKIIILSLLLISCATGAKREVASASYNFEVLKELSSDAYEGRGVGTQGLNRARDLLQREMQALGLEPAVEGKTGRSYLQPFRVFIGNELGAKNSFAGKAGADFMPLAFSKSGLVKNAGLVFVGFGISLRQGDKIVYDDYAGLDVKGKVVIALLGDPGTGNPKSPFRDPANYHYSSPMYKVQNAELHGAAGIVLVRDPLSLDNGKEPRLWFQSRQGGGATSSILAGQASIHFAQKVLGKNLTEVQKKIAKSQKPASFQLSRKATMQVDLIRHLGEVQNVVGFFPGKNPALAKEYIVVGAHYDHLGFGGDSSMDPSGIGKIHHGADDNASGVQAVLHLAEMIKLVGNERPILFTLFSAEEVGLLGSKQFVETLPLPEGARVAAMINLDMVGRLKDRKLTVLALRSAKEFNGIVDKVNEDFRFTLSKGDSGFGSSDHASFLLMKIPSIFFTTGAHADYHRPTDTFEKINQEGQLEVEKFVLEVWRDIDSASKAPEYDPSSEDGNQPPRPGHGYGAYFGSIPDFAEGNAVEGVLLQGVKPGSPAEKVGLQAKDILTGMGEIKVKNLYDFVFALRFYRPNETIKVTWVRDGKKMEGMATLKSRE